VDYICDHRLQAVPFYNQVALIGTAGRSILPFVHGHEIAQTVEDAIVFGDLTTAREVIMRDVFPYSNVMRRERARFIQHQSLSIATFAMEEQPKIIQFVRNYTLRVRNSDRRLNEMEKLFIGNSFFDFQHEFQKHRAMGSYGLNDSDS